MKTVKELQAIQFKHIMEHGGFGNLNVPDPVVNDLNRSIMQSFLHENGECWAVFPETKFYEQVFQGAVIFDHQVYFLSPSKEIAEAFIVECRKSYRYAMDVFSPIVGVVHLIWA